MMNPAISANLKPRRGRPPKADRQFVDTRQALIRSGLEVLTETGYLAAGIDAVIKNIAVPKGSFTTVSKARRPLASPCLPPMATTLRIN